MYISRKFMSSGRVVVAVVVVVEVEGEEVVAQVVLVEDMEAGDRAVQGLEGEVRLKWAQ